MRSANPSANEATASIPKRSRGRNQGRALPAQRPAVHRRRHVPPRATLLGWPQRCLAPWSSCILAFRCRDRRQVRVDFFGGSRCSWDELQECTICALETNGRPRLIFDPMASDRRAETIPSDLQRSAKPGLAAGRPLAFNTCALTRRLRPVSPVSMPWAVSPALAAVAVMVIAASTVALDVMVRRADDAPGRTPRGTR